MDATRRIATDFGRVAAPRALRQAENPRGLAADCILQVYRVAGETKPPGGAPGHRDCTGSGVTVRHLDRGTARLVSGRAECVSASRARHDRDGLRARADRLGGDRRVSCVGRAVRARCGAAHGRDVELKRIAGDGALREDGTGVASARTRSRSARPSSC